MAMFGRQVTNIPEKWEIFSTLLNVHLIELNPLGTTYFPVNSAFLFSKKAATPSLKSSEPKQLENSAISDS